MIGREGEEDHPNQWPAAEGTMQDFKTVVLDFFDQCGLHAEVMPPLPSAWTSTRASSTASLMTATTRCDCCTTRRSRKRLPASTPGQVRAGEHSDYGSITLLFQDSRGGLQVKSPNGQFVECDANRRHVRRPTPGIYWRAGAMTRFVAQSHRVVEPPRAEGETHPPRYSIACCFCVQPRPRGTTILAWLELMHVYRYFCNPNFKSHIEVLPGT